MTEVWVVVADYGLNGAGVLGVFHQEPTEAECQALATAKIEGASFPHTFVTGWSGWEVQRWVVA